MVGIPFDIRKYKEHVKFRLPNMPEFDCTIDKEDFETYIEGSKCWFIHASYYKGRIKTKYIVGRHGGGKHKFLHRIIAGNPIYDAKLSLVDHINIDSLDNRRKNIRVITASESNYNKKCSHDKIKNYMGYMIRKIDTSREGIYYRAKKERKGPSVQAKTLNVLRAKIREKEKIA